MHFAAEHGHADVIVYIIRFANSKNRQIVDVQVRLYYRVSEKALMIFFKDNQGKTALHMASENGKTNSMAALLEWGADVDTQR